MASKITPTDQDSKSSHGAASMPVDRRRNMLFLIILLGTVAVSYGIVKSLIDHNPTLPSVEVGSISAASVTRLSSATASASSVEVSLLVGHINNRALSFSRVTLSAAGAVSHAPPFEIGETSARSVVRFRLANLTVPVGPTGIPSLKVEFGARVRYGGSTWPPSKEEISMSASCSPTMITYDLNIDHRNVTAAEILSSGGCESSGRWTNIKEQGVILVVVSQFITLLDILILYVVALRLGDFYKSPKYPATAALP